MTEEETDEGEVLMSQARMLQMAVIILMTLLFIVVGYLAPAMFAGVTPDENHIEVHQFTVQDAGTNSTEHYYCFDRTVHAEDGATGRVYYELFTVNENGNRYEISAYEETRYFAPGEKAILSDLPLPDELPEGQYQYSLVIDMNMADGRVTRQFTFTSEPFTVQENYTRSSLQEFSKTCGSSDG